MRKCNEQLPTPGKWNFLLRCETGYGFHAGGSGGDEYIMAGHYNVQQTRFRISICMSMQSLAKLNSFHIYKWSLSEEAPCKGLSKCFIDIKLLDLSTLEALIRAFHRPSANLRLEFSCCTRLYCIFLSFFSSGWLVGRSDDAASHSLRQSAHFRKYMGQEKKYSCCCK